MLVARSGEKLKALSDELAAKHQVDCRYFAIDLLEFEADVAAIRWDGEEGSRRSTG